jgi:23S rRNA (cytidine1920-2'-O)/16S rRNA (cytidine1409-2'-O)-methyltransferase
MKERVDKLLVDKGLAPTRGKSQRLIMAGLVFAGGRAVLKPGELVDDAEPLEVKGALPFASRGGLKLAEALDAFKLDVAGLAAVDIGSSTGGFTDCLLQRGAARVFAVDVDTKQLDYRLRNDPRVTLVEKNARYLEPGDIGRPVDIFTMDVSFISVSKIMPAVRKFAGNWVLVSLIKPQFEAGRLDVGKNGVVRSAEIHEKVLRRVIGDAAGLGLALRGMIRCSTRGQKGNVEFFGYWAAGGPALPEDETEARVKEALSDEKG